MKDYNMYTADLRRWGWGYTIDGSQPQQMFRGTMEEVLQKISKNSQYRQIVVSNIVRKPQWFYKSEPVMFYDIEKNIVQETPLIDNNGNLQKTQYVLS